MKCIECKEIKIKAYCHTNWYALLKRKILPAIFLKKPRDKYIYEKVNVIIREKIESKWKINPKKFETI